jgi:hypothetical protein
VARARFAAYGLELGNGIPDVGVVIRIGGLRSLAAVAGTEAMQSLRRTAMTARRGTGALQGFDRQYSK